jgi:hypothetical protein
VSDTTQFPTLINLTASETARLAEDLENPPPPNAALKAAWGRYNETMNTQTEPTATQNRKCPDCNIALTIRTDCPIIYHCSSCNMNWQERWNPYNEKWPNLWQLPTEESVINYLWEDLRERLEDNEDPPKDLTFERLEEVRRLLGIIGQEGEEGE